MEGVSSAGTGASVGRALARIGLLGNPSDGYGGAVLAATIRDFGVEVQIRSDERFLCDGVEVRDWANCDARELAGAAPLLIAALRCFHRHAGPAAARLGPLRMTMTSSVPFRVGLSGSSAIVIAALRALGQRSGIALSGPDLARLALEAETEELDITAGPQDRVIQAHEGVLLMDFHDEWTSEAVELSLLPPLFLAWQTAGGEDSGRTHDEVRPRFLARDPEVVAAMQRFREIAHDGTRALRSRELERFGRLMNENFDLRASLFPIAARDRELVVIARSNGSPAKFCGSGGGVVGVVRDNRDRLEAAYSGAGFSFLVPTAGSCDS